MTPDDGDTAKLDVEGRLLCLCPACSSKFEDSEKILLAGALEDVELEGGVAFPLEELEALRLYLQTFLKPETLQAILDVYKVLEKEPKPQEKYAWFIRNSTFGAECKHAIAALNHFKKNRLDGLEGALERALEAVRKLSE